ncbi:SDR family oxidoreductase [Alloalcanivorax gelatiniphagus]|uniref:SDR family oxidoreductase n=1 Tax=Alloalcanivorax gelatiniphagus TaxID=1194167 RepID=A0ABY2XHW5_9GAMM|nr:SDR family oxidoreductase [Alloalcanivorax gelatiniphagus]TMW11342.1 SDR family oxidoreductase [Alloalcanivorax gelatiniphagus]|tara:strand:- start:14016 stop:14951 length:936 start_codon:yes stop_codon:yes gene_type:complete
MSRILITGAAGYIGRQLGERLAAHHQVLGLDVRVPEGLPFECRQGDIRDPALGRWMAEQGTRVVVHLAAVLEDSGDRARDHDIDVNGTRNVLEACVANGVEQLIVTSSGAAYGYHADNPPWLDEDAPLRGNPEFAYSDHKRQVEELLARYRHDHPRLGQLILRPGTVLGATTHNQITALFEGRRVLAIAGSDSPFVFIWDQDVVGAILHGIDTGARGVYNLAGDGALPIQRVAALLGKPLRVVPAWLLAGALAVGKRLRLTGHSPEKVNFLRYRPVLDNRRLKQEFGYRPRKTSEETFRFFIEQARARGRL